MYFQDVHPDVLEAYVIWLDTKDQGKWVKSTEINPLNPRKLTKADLYTKEERKKIKPSEECQVMFMESNHQARHITDFLKREFNRKVKEVSYDGNCMFSSILAQISHHVYKYKPEHLRKQTAYYLAKHWEKFTATARSICDEPLESYIYNLYHGYSYGDLLCLGIIGVMWDLKITIINPELEQIKIFHSSKKPDVILVYNNRDDLNGHYCATVGVNDKWLPVRGIHHSAEVRVVANIRKHAKEAETHYHTVKRQQLKDEYDYLMEELETAVDGSLAMRTKIDNMEESMCDMASDIKTLQAKTGLLKGKLLIQGVEVEDFSKRKTFDISMLQPGYLSRNQPPVQPALPETTTPTPPIHTTSRPPIITPITATPTTSGTLQTTPGGVQELRQGSIRWGRVLKGTHNFFCDNCQKPFTKKSDLKTHMRCSCLNKGKKSYKCHYCEKAFSYEQSLKDHINSKHTGAKPYKCESCKETFSTNNQVVAHRKVCSLHFFSPSLQDLNRNDFTFIQ